MTEQRLHHRPRRIGLRFLGASLLLSICVCGTVAGDTGAVGAAESARRFGAPVTLVDQRRRPVDEASFAGEHLLVYFGYTHCPDLCPMGLAAAAMALRQLGEAGERVRPVFVTVDPQRDTAERLQEYVAAFHPRLVGLTGTSDAVRAAANAYDVRFMRAEVGGEVIVDHTSGTYLVGPDGAVMHTFDHGASPREMSAAIAELLP